MTLIASYLRYWPFGFVRTNFYLVPLLILLAGIGAVWVTRGLAAWMRKAPWNRSWPARAGVAAVAVAAIVVAVGLAATYEAGSYAEIRDSASYVGWGAVNRFGGRCGQGAGKAG